MPHAALDIRFWSNPKILEGGNAAVGLYARSLSYSCDLLTDGYVGRAWAKANGKPREIAALVRVGLWVEHPDGYVIPRFLEFNWSREQALKRSADKKRAGQLGARKRWHGDTNGSSDNDHIEALTT